VGGWVGRRKRLGEQAWAARRTSMLRTAQTVAALKVRRRECSGRFSEAARGRNGNED